MRYVAVLSAAVVMAAIGAAGAGAEAQIATGGLAAGSGLVRFGDFAFSISAGAHGDAEGARGTLAMTAGGNHYLATADCVLVFGNSALIVGTLKEPVGLFTKLVTEIVDNGNGASGVPDNAVSGLAMDFGGFDQCHPSFVSFSDAFPVVHGNFVVHAD
jgi:hypothetical protein